jgi:glycosyltransferase involved in cell wall biosynthesis
MSDRPVPEVSVVVATYNRSERLRRLVAALEAQSDAPTYELVLVDDASDDETGAVVDELVEGARFPITAVRLPVNRGPAAARNAGWRQARGGVVAFTDDDCAPAPGWLAALTAATVAADLAQGRTLPDPEQIHLHGPFGRSLEIVEENGFYATCNMAYGRAVLEHLGGFDEQFRHPAGEDTDLAWRAIDAGFRTVFAPEAIVHHDVRPSSFVARLRDTARWEGMVLAVRRHPRLRARLHLHWFWKRSHPPALAALAGAVLVTRSGLVPRVLGLAGLLAYGRFRWVVWPVPGTRRQRILVMPLLLVADLAEVGVMAAASVRHRTVVL